MSGVSAIHELSVFHRENVLDFNFRPPLSSYAAGLLSHQYLNSPDIIDFVIFPSAEKLSITFRLPLSSTEVVHETDAAISLLEEDAGLTIELDNVLEFRRRA